MTKKRVTGFERVQRELAAEQIGLNPAVWAVFGAIRQVSAHPHDAEALQRLAKVNKALPLLEVGDPVSGLQRQIRMDAKTRTWQVTSTLAWRSLEAIVDAANTGHLNRFRQCPMCSRWFYARTHEQKCCTSRCRQKLYSTSRKGKKERSKYMRKYRADTKERDRRREAAYLKALDQKAD